ncbi:MAG: alpha/beta hydrolase, partial [Planctomycetaceae bacterium]|nr:alpha/beta hydrolase [Planctomycetaceae bacterium]
GPGSTRDWKLVLQEYAFESDEQARAYDQNPVNQLAPLAKAGVPLLHVFGDADEVVPWKENTGLLAQRYRELGGHIQLIQKVGVKHHPHGLEDPTPIVEFIEQHAALDPPPGPRQRNDPVGQLAVKLTPSREVVYKTTPQGELTLHVFEPEGWKVEDRRPCLLFVHGGGWSGGEPRRMYPFADHFSHLGCVAISLEYRLLNRKRGTTVFDCVEDGRSAVRFLRQHPATFGIDPDRIVVSGASAGGHVAVGTALFHDVNAESDPEDISATPNALALFFPVIDTSKDGYGQAKIGDRWRELSPVHQVGAGVPPTILFHGTGDTVTPYAGAEAFTKAMHEAGNTCELIPHLSGVHGYLMFVEELYRQTLRQMEEFLLHHSLLDK